MRPSGIAVASDEMMPSGIAVVSIAALLMNKFDTSQIKEPVRKYLEDCGWKKGLF